MSVGYAAVNSVILSIGGTAVAETQTGVYITDAYMDWGVGTGVELLKYEYLQKTNESWWELKDKRSPMDWIPLKDVILPYIKYKDPMLQDVLEDMKKQIVYSKERKGYEKKLVLSNVVYSIGVGGIHSLNKPRIFRPKEDEFIGHSDVASMYPSFIIKYKWI